MTMKNKSAALFLMYDGLTDPLGQSQVLPYLKELSRNYSFDVIGFEKKEIFELQKALSEMQRVSKNGYIMLESYRNELEQFNLQCWALTCESFFDQEEWIWIYDHFGYSGDYEFIFFE